MRVFVAIHVPDDVRLMLAEVQRRLQLATTSARWVAPESIHLTLKFLGEISETRLEDINRELTSLRWVPFQVTVRGIGFFPGERSPRVLWAGLTATTLAELAEEIDARLERCGFPREARSFRPHLTLARAKDNRLDAGLVREARQFEDADFGAFTVNRCFLMQSTLKPGGAVYTKLREYVLNS